MPTLTSEDVLYISRKSLQESTLKAAQESGEANFEYAKDEELETQLDTVVELLSPTIEELKNR